MPPQNPPRSFPRAFEIATRRPVAVLMVFLAVVVFGFISYQRLAINLMPDISYPSLTVRTEYPGTAPEEVETAISRPLEQALGVVDGLVTISSVSQAGLSDIIIEYRWDTNMDQALQEVREKMDQVFLPEEAERPLVLRYDPTLDPIIRLGLHGGADLFTLRWISEEEIKRALEKVPGVAAVRVRGGYEEEIRVNVSERQLTGLGLSLAQVNQRLFQENINIAGGNLKEGDTEYVVRTLNEFAGLEEIADLVVAHQGEVPIRLRDFATVERAYKDREVISRVGGEEAVEIDIYKEADANLVQVAKNVREAVFGTPEQQARWEAAQKAAPEAQKRSKKVTGRAGQRSRGRGGSAPAASSFIAATLPADMNMVLLSDQSTFVEASIRDVRQAALMGGLLAVLVLFFFLRNFTSTLIIGISIPISVIATFAPMHLAHVTLNIMSLGGLALGIGMLVDNSIVVLESIFRCREEGDSIQEAAVRGTGEVGGAVVASTLTTVAVFFPIVFVEGVAGQVFGDMALTVVFSLLASLGVAIYLIPMLASRNLQALAGSASGEKIPPLKNLLAFTFWLRLRHGLAATGRWWRRGRTGRRMLLVIPATAGILLVLLRAIIELSFNLVQKVFLLALALLGLALKYGGKLLGKLALVVLKPFLKLFEMGFARLSALFDRALSAALEHPGRALGGAGLLAAFCFLVLLPNLGRELIPEVHQGEFTIEMTFPAGTPVETTARRALALERTAATLEEVEQISLAAGVEKTAFSSSEEGEHTAKFNVRLKPGGDLQTKEERVIQVLRADLADIPEMETKVTHPVLFSVRTPIEVEVRGYNLAELGRLAEQIEAAMAGLPGLVDVKSSFAMGNPEIRVNYDRERVAALGLNVYQIASLVRHKVLGEVATDFRKGDRRIDVRVKVRDEDRASVDDLKRLVVNPGGKQPIPLAAVAEVVQDRGPARIWRVDQQRTAKLSANVSGSDLGSAVEDLDARLADLQIPETMSVVISGQNREMQESLSSLAFALLLAVFLVYVVMAVQFESLLNPFIILFTVPLAGIGVILTLWTLNLSLSIVVYLGMITLAGVVVNNAIVLVDYTNTLRARGMKVKEAIRTAAGVRLRPIMMTTLTTVLGLLPMALGFGEGAEIRTPMAVTVIAGLISSTLLTLIIIPVIYALINRDKDLATDRSDTDIISEIS
ncbi:MAG: efflux RND transporter permease subunit [Candidatus Zixiibacteriota bacterium]|nr:MAG: efflux RND transporter permease subunit [candidate division Zixibacteria bacterium]